MKKHLLLLLAFLSFGLLGLAGNSKTAQAAPWGARKVYTTPKATRGTWYYKEGHHIRRWKITAHYSHGRKLYRVLPSKSYDKWWHRLIRASRKKIKKVDRTMWQAYTIRYHGIKGFNSNGWLTGAGDGIYYVPVHRTRHGKRVKALRFGGGARNWKMFYAYKSKRLAR